MVLGHILTDLENDALEAAITGSLAAARALALVARRLQIACGKSQMMM